MLAQESYATSRLDRLFIAELRAFHSNFDVAPVPVEQELRAGAIGWIATFAPKAISPHGKEELRRVSTAARDRMDFKHFGWYRVPYLDVAQYSLDGDISSLSTMIDNIDHHDSSLRSSLHGPLALIAPRLSLDDNNLSGCIESCLSSGYMYNDSLMCIFAALNDDHERKLTLARKWRMMTSLNPQDIKTLDLVLAGELISNALIADEFSEVLRYIFCRLLDPDVPDALPGQQLDLPLSSEDCPIWQEMSLSAPGALWHGDDWSR